MPSFTIRNEVRRDELPKFAYPFDETSTLENDELALGLDLFLDAMLFFKDSRVVAPIHIMTIDGTMGTPQQFGLILGDSTGAMVGDALVTGLEETVRVYNSADVLVGLLVLGLDAVKRFAGGVTGQVFHLEPEVAAFCLECTHVVSANYLRYLDVLDTALAGDVDLVARHGCRWRLNNDGTIQLDVVSDPPSGTEQTYVRSINGVVNRSIWLAHHAKLNLRLETTGGRLRFVAVRDDTR